MRKKKNNLLISKLLFTSLIIILYLVGRSIPLINVDNAGLAVENIDPQTLLMQTIGGDYKKYSVFALGISPYMMSSVIVQMILACRSSDAKARISPKRVNLAVILLTLVVGTIQSVLLVRDLKFNGSYYLLDRAVAVSELMTGALIILWLSARNKKYGIGGQTALIYVNVCDSFVRLIASEPVDQLVIPIIISLAIVIIVGLMEMSELRIPVQRISIHNIYADKNYMAIKLNPIGVMPVMFSTAVFMLPQLAFNMLGMMLPENDLVHRINENLNMNTLPGIIVFLVIVYLLTIIFSFIFINPGDITEQMLKSGDSFLDIHAGKETQRFLRRRLLHVSLISASVMCLILGTSMSLKISGVISSSLSMLPSTVMIITGIWCNIYQEFLAVRDSDSYREFL
ncbi:MAG: preprotein translocase subunit SecY [Lachnospiraceae bacterium]|nr:preprotein translocase subunit SecY [Lachnospiraceae bacterium]